MGGRGWSQSWTLKCRKEISPTPVCKAQHTFFWSKVLVILVSQAFPRWTPFGGMWSIRIFQAGKTYTCWDYQRDPLAWSEPLRKLHWNLFHLFPSSLDACIHVSVQSLECFHRGTLHIFPQQFFSKLFFPDILPLTSHSKEEPIFIFTVKNFQWDRFWKAKDPSLHPHP